MGKLAAIAVCLTGLAGPAAAYSGDHFKVCRLDPNGDNFLAFREGPTSQSRLLLKMGPGYDVEVRGQRENGRWFPAATVDSSGKFIFGYVYDSFVCPQHPPQLAY